ncbi:MAG TPA: heme o synthase [Candidatus Saccharimonadales bacterium]|nr:heme o synthase [Candidatus Saccharimonadales bacterium]
MAGYSVLRTYYYLAKPGIVYGNILSTCAGFLLAANGHIKLSLFTATISGTALVIASACVVNNYIDREIDEKMERTRKRAIVSGAVSPAGAFIYAGLLGVIGFTALAISTNWLTFAVGATGYFFYVVVYGTAKRTTIYGTIIGSISGSMPLVAGYTAVTDRLDGGALLLFLLMTVWQMPHFYAIAIYRLKDYQAAGLPVWPVKRGIRSTKRQIILFIALFTIISARLSLGGHTGKTYLAATVLLGLAWLYKGALGIKTKDDAKWARGMFGFSLVVLLGMCAALSLNAWLP